MFRGVSRRRSRPRPAFLGVAGSVFCVSRTFPGAVDTEGGVSIFEGGVQIGLLVARGRLPSAVGLQGDEPLVLQFPQGAMERAAVRLVAERLPEVMDVEHLRYPRQRVPDVSAEIPRPPGVRPWPAPPVGARPPASGDWPPSPPDWRVGGRPPRWSSARSAPPPRPDAGTTPGGSRSPPEAAPPAAAGAARIRRVSCLCVSYCDARVGRDARGALGAPSPDAAV